MKNILYLHPNISYAQTPFEGYYPLRIEYVQRHYKPINTQTVIKEATEESLDCECQWQEDWESACDQWIPS